MRLVADARRWCWPDVGGWYLALWEVAPLPHLNDHSAWPWPLATPRQYGPYATQGAALGAFWELGAVLVNTDWLDEVPA